MIAKLDMFIKIWFVFLIMLLIVTIFLTIYSTYLSNQTLNTYSTNMGLYVFDIE